MSPFIIEAPTITASPNGEAHRLLDALLRGGQYGNLWTYPAKATTWWKVGEEIPEVKAPDQDIYFGVHPTRRIPEIDKHGKKAGPSAVRSRVSDIACINCLFADFDLKLSPGKTKDELLQHIQTLAKPPTWIIDSGGGFHAYWLLREPFYITNDEERNEAACLQRSWVEALGGDQGARDLARVLRVPGTVNHKYDSLPVVTVIDEDGPTYDLDELQAAITAKGAPASKQPEPTANLIPAGQRHEHMKRVGVTWAKTGMATDAIVAGLRQIDGNGESPYPTPDFELIDLAKWCVANTGPKAGAALTTTTWADHAATIDEISWLWPAWLPRGFLILLAAQSEIGKSALAMYVCAALTDGRRFPDGSEPEARGRVLWVDTEAAQVMNYSRARAWGVDMECFVVPTVNSGSEDLDLGSPEGWASLESAARIEDIVLVVVDSLGGAVARENDETMKVFVHKLAGLARDTGKPILLIHHPRKLVYGEPDEMTLDRVRGSSGIVQFARVIWTIETPNPFEEDTKRLRVLKSNLGPKPKPLGFAITKDGLTFSAPPERPEESSKLVEAENFIRELLKDHKPKSASVFLEQAAAKGINEKTLKRAKASLGVVSQHAQEGRGWVWLLPSKKDADE